MTGRPDEIKVYHINPEAAGWKLLGKDRDGRNVWLTDKGERHTFPQGQPEQLVVPSFPFALPR